MNPRDIKPQIGTPTNRLFWAINHYVSTGDHIGEGVAQEVGGKLLFLIPVRVAAEQDQRDLAAFRARFDELAEPYQTARCDTWGSTTVSSYGASHWPRIRPMILPPI